MDNENILAMIELRDVTRLSGLVLACGAVVSMLLAAGMVRKYFVRLRPVTAFVLSPLFVSVICAAFYCFGELVDQPHLRAFSHIAHDATWHAFTISIPITAIMSCDALLQRQSMSKDIIYFPTWRSLLASLYKPAGRLIFIAGMAIVASNYILTIAEEARQEAFAGGALRPPQRVFMSCILLWCILWIVDCWGRPSKGTIVAAIGLFVLCCALASITGMDFVRG